MAADAIFGDVLNAGLAAAGGELVVKMDDDDWYGPDFLLDLLLARHYSGAEVVGTTAEFVYLTASNRTVRRNKPTEVAARSVAGGTMLLGRDHLRSLGGFRRVRRFVDASLLSAVHATGGTVYRAHVGRPRRLLPRSGDPRPAVAGLRAQQAPRRESGRLTSQRAHPVEQGPGAVVERELGTRHVAVRRGSAELGEGGRDLLRGSRHQDVPWVENVVHPRDVVADHPRA
jgi:hypothetical protein